jgi:hypothetical protein
VLAREHCLCRLSPLPQAWAPPRLRPLPASAAHVVLCAHHAQHINSHNTSKPGEAAAARKTHAHVAAACFAAAKVSTRPSRARRQRIAQRRGQIRLNILDRQSGEDSVGQELREL